MTLCEESVLVSSQLSDDETLFGAYLLLRHRPLVVVCFRSFRMGERSYPHRDFRMTFQEREAETNEAMKHLGCLWEQWTIPDKDPSPENSLRQAMGSLGEDWDQIFAPAVEEDGQYQHDIIGQLAGEMFGEKVTYYLTYSKWGRSRDGAEVIPEPDWPATKLRALACYETQIRHPSTRSHFLDGGLREYIQR